MIQIGKFTRLKVLRQKSAGLYLEGSENGILLPNRYVPKDAKPDDEIDVFVYHDSEGRLIATTQHPYGLVDEVRLLKVVSVTSIGAFLDWGLMKDLFVPKNSMRNFMRVNGQYLVRIILDKKTGRITATEYIEDSLGNDTLTFNERDKVDLTVYRKTQIGYEVIINNFNRGILHFNEVYRPIQIGDHFNGFVKKIFKNEKTGETLVDVVADKQGYTGSDDEATRILELLNQHNGFLPYYDKSSPEEIYAFFKMSKRNFKMAIGHLYKQHKISLTKTGIQLL